MSLCLLFPKGQLFLEHQGSLSVSEHFRSIQSLVGLQDENMESLQNEGAYRAVLYTCVAAHWVTLLTAMHLVGTTSINPLAMLGEALTAQVQIRCSGL